MAGGGGVQVVTCEARFRDTVSRGNLNVCLFVLKDTDSLWAYTSYKWGYNSFEWPYTWATEVTTSTTLLIRVIFLLITGRGPPCRGHNYDPSRLSSSEGKFPCHSALICAKKWLTGFYVWESYHPQNMS